MFRKVYDTLWEVEALLEQKPGVVVGGDQLLMRNLQKLFMYLRSLGDAPSTLAVDGQSLQELLQRLRLSLLGLDQSFDAPLEERKLKAGVLEAADFGELVRGLKNLLGQIKNRMDVLEAGESSSNGVGSREKLIKDLDERKGQETSAVKFSLQGLDRINQREGRETGDRILQRIAGIIRELCGNEAQIYQDGPGFVALGNWQEEEQIRDLSSRVTGKIAMDPRGKTLEVVIGVVMNESEDILEKARMAAGGSEGQPVFFSPSILQQKQEEQKEYFDAIKVLEEKNFYPEYQEIFTRGGVFQKQQRKFEALWRSSEMTPIKFFGAIKSEHRVSEVTGHMLPMIFRDIQGRSCEIAVNMTPEELSSPFEGMPFPQFVVTQSKQFGISPSNLIIELVEWSEQDTLSEEGIMVLKHLKKMGCKLALDDYGVRSSNLVRLMQLCENSVLPDYIKIDAALIKGYNRYIHDPSQGGRYRYAIIGIRSIVDLVKELRKETRAKIGIVAEFVDNQALLKALEKLGVTHFQGFFLSKPKPAGELF